MNESSTINSIPNIFLEFEKLVVSIYRYTSVEILSPVVVRVESGIGVILCSEINSADCMYL